jgi:hypothetical protein
MNITQGEWEVDTNDSKIRIASRKIYPPFLAELFHSSSVPYGEALSNAHLIAAAPDMYEALKHILNSIPEPTRKGLSVNWQVIDAAIAKAEGK